MRLLREWQLCSCVGCLHDIARKDGSCSLRSRIGDSERGVGGEGVSRALGLLQQRGVAEGGGKQDARVKRSTVKAEACALPLSLALALRSLLQLHLGPQQ